MRRTDARFLPSTTLTFLSAGFVRPSETASARILPFLFGHPLLHLLDDRWKPLKMKRLAVMLQNLPFCFVKVALLSRKTCPFVFQDLPLLKNQPLRKVKERMMKRMEFFDDQYLMICIWDNGFLFVSWLLVVGSHCMFGQIRMDGMDTRRKRKTLGMYTARQQSAEMEKSSRLFSTSL